MNFRKEQQAKINGVTITYIYKKGKFDCRHLVVIFSGFGLHNNYTYDFSGPSLENVPSHIIWIKDCFFNNCCYYMCHKMDFSIEKSVKDFIFNFCRENFLDTDNITLVGGSKGGSAALYFCIKYNFKNAISAAPQIQIGSFNTKIHKDIAAHMMRDEKDIHQLDQLFEKTIERATNTNKNIYLFSSPTDQWETCMQIHGSLKKFKNFNHIITESRCVQQHNQITSYNIPLILSLILAHGQGVHPCLGEWFYNGLPDPQPYTDIILQRQRERKEVVAKITACSFEKDIFFPEGVAFLRGVPSPAYGYFKKYLILERQDETKDRFSILIGSTSSEKFSRDYYEDVYCNYFTAGFASRGKKGISLIDIPIGRYRLILRVEGKGLAAEAQLEMKTGESVGAGAHHIYRISNEDGFTYLHILPAISEYRPDNCTVTQQWSRGFRIHYEGTALRYGLEAGDWSDTTAWLVLKSNTSTHIFKYGRNKITALNSRFDGCGKYATSNFCSPARRGVDLSSLDKGIYNVFITIQYKHALLSEQIAQLTLDATGAHSKGLV